MEVLNLLIFTMNQFLQKSAKILTNFSKNRHKRPKIKFFFSFPTCQPNFVRFWLWKVSEMPFVSFSQGLSYVSKESAPGRIVPLPKITSEWINACFIVIFIKPFTLNLITTLGLSLPHVRSSPTPSITCHHCAAPPPGTVVLPREKEVYWLSNGTGARRRSVYGVEFLCCAAVMCRMGEAQLVVVVVSSWVEGNTYIANSKGKQFFKIKNCVIFQCFDWFFIENEFDFILKWGLF